MISKEEIRKMAEKQWEKDNDIVQPLGINPAPYVLGFQAGFRASQQSHRYTKLDIEKTVLWVLLFTSNSGRFPEPEEIDIYISSLTTQPDSIKVKDNDNG